MTKRDPARWMCTLDERILEIIRKEGQTPVGEIVDRDEVLISQSSVSRRCQKLAENGLLLPIGNGVYDITDEGEAYLDEEYDAENGAYLNAGEQPNGPSASESTEP